MLIKVKKVWLGHVSVRDYIVKKCIKEKEDLTIDLYGVTKTYSYRSLKTHLANTTPNKFHSKYNGESYSLIDFPWTSTLY